MFVEGDEFPVEVITWGPATFIAEGRWIQKYETHDRPVLEITGLGFLAASGTDLERFRHPTFGKRLYELVNGNELRTGSTLALTDKGYQQALVALDAFYEKTGLGKLGGEGNRLVPPRGETLHQLLTRYGLGMYAGTMWKATRHDDRGIEWDLVVMLAKRPPGESRQFLTVGINSFAPIDGPPINGPSEWWVTVPVEQVEAALQKAIIAQDYALANGHAPTDAQFSGLRWRGRTAPFHLPAAKKLGRQQCKALIPVPDQSSSANPELVQCRYAAVEGSPYCSRHPEWNKKKPGRVLEGVGAYDVEHGYWAAQDWLTQAGFTRAASSRWWWLPGIMTSVATTQGAVLVRLYASESLNWSVAVVGPAPRPYDPLRDFNRGARAVLWHAFGPAGDFKTLPDIVNRALVAYDEYLSTGRVSPRISGVALSGTKKCARKRGC